jgi:RHS repeat-associated protein
MRLRLISSLLLLLAPVVIGAQTGSMRVSLPSAGAASLGKFGDVPVSLANGTPDVSVPIFTLRGRTINVPIALKYHASGVRVEEIGSWVGLGWALEAGGSITRTVRGLADEKPAGYYTTGTTWYAPGAWPTPTTTLLDAIANETIDPEPDHFVFSFAGRSGQFVMGPTSATPGSQQIRTIPYQRLRIVPNSPTSLDSWVITTEDGTQYTFDATETNTDLSYSVTGGEVPAHYGESFVSSWHLTKIKAPGGDSVTFHYGGYSATHALATHREKFDQVIDPNPPACVSGSATMMTMNTIGALVLDSIKGATHTVRFVRGATLRTDALSPSNAVPSDAQQEPSLAKVVVTTPTGTVLREFVLGQDYGIDGRLTLRSVTERDRNGNSLPPYTFAYYSGAESFPARTSAAQDHFGYFNGKVLQSDLIPGAMTPSGLWLPGADRTADAAYARIGALSRITHPTGGYNEFVYGVNDYGAVGQVDQPPTGFGPLKSASALADNYDGSVTSEFTIGGNGAVNVTVDVTLTPANCGTQFGCPYVEIVGAALWTAPGTYSVTLNPGTYTLHAAEELIGGLAFINVSWRELIIQKKKPAGGLRLEELRTADAMGTIAIKKYLYVLPSDTSRSSGVVNQEPRYDYTVNTVGCAYFSRSTTSKTPIGAGPVVGYRYVTVLHGANGEFGRDEHAFRTPMEVADAPVSGARWPGARTTSSEWMRGQEIRSVTTSASGVTQRRTAQVWFFEEAPSAQPLAVQRFRALSTNSFAGGAGSVTAHNAFEVVSGWSYLSSDTTVSYDEAGANAITSNRTTRYENPAHGMATRISETGIGGRRRITRMRYPDDYPAGSGDPEATALGLMRGSAHMPGVVIEQVVEDSGSTVGVLQATLTTHRTTALGQTLPYEMFQLSAPSPATGVATSTVSGGVFVKDSRYVKLETAVTYDAFGRVTRLADADGALTDYQYGGVNNALLTNVTRRKSLAGGADPGDLVTTLVYDSDNFLEKRVDESARAERYKYDGFGRLIETRNNDSLLVATYAYAYSRTSGNGWTFNPATPNVVTTTTYMQHSPTTRSVVTRDWLDGLGATIQSSIQAGSTYHVTATQYDAMGRQWRKWKPYTRTSAAYDASFAANATAHYNTYLGVGNSKPYEETQYTTDALGRIQRVTPAYVGTTATAFRLTSYGNDVVMGQPYVQQGDELGKLTRAYTDILGNPARSVLGFGAAEAATAQMTHDLAGRRTQVTDPKGVVTTNTFDTRGFATTTTNVDAGTVQRKFDRAGLLRFSQDANQAAAGTVMFTTYDVFDRVSVVGVGAASFAGLDPDATAAIETATANWLTVKAYDAKPPTGSFPWSLFATQITPLTLQRSHGRLTAEAHKSNGAWQVTLFSYDAEGRVATKYQYTQNTAATATWTALNTTLSSTYDLRGALTYRAMTVGTNNWYQWSDYDDRGLLWKVFASTSSTKPATADVTVTYRTNGDVADRQFSGGPLVPFRYTILDQLERIGDPATTTSPFSARYSYNANGTVYEAEWRQVGTPSTRPRARYLYPTTAYDALNRLKTANYSSYDNGWPTTAAFDVNNITYDAAGNLMALQRYRSAATLVDNLTYTYGAGSNRLLSITDAVSGSSESWDAETGSFTYDANGNLKTAPAPYALTNATYDAWNRLLSVTKAGVTTQYRSTASGHRLAQWTGSGSIKVTLRDGPVVLGDVTLNSSGTPTAWHFNVHAGERAVGRQPNTGARLHYHSDLLGSIRAVTAGTTIVEVTDYDPWGVELDGRTTVNGPTLEGFTEKQRDAVVGWDDFGARQYMSALGRWAGYDPAASVMPEWSSYAYALNNPVSEIDIEGAIPWTKLVKVGKAIYQGGDVAAAFADNIQQAKTVFNPAASPIERAWAGAQLVVSVVSPVDVSDVKAGVTAVTRVANRADDAADAARATRRASQAADDVPQRGANMGEDAAQAVHGNDNRSMRPHHRYEIWDTHEDKAFKTGISGGPLNQNGSSPRANRQVNALNQDEAGRYEARVEETDIPGRAEAKRREQAATNRLGAAGHTLPGQVRPRPNNQ